MVGDTPAILAIFWREPEHHQSLELFRQADSWPFSAGNALETMPLLKRRGPTARNGR
jgi:uncharacterized protein with PIN domain